MPLEQPADSQLTDERVKGRKVGGGKRVRWRYVSNLPLQIVKIILECLEKFLRYFKDDENIKVVDEIRNCGGLDKIENLKEHEGERIRGLAKKIIDIYFVSEFELPLSSFSESRG